MKTLKELFWEDEPKTEYFERRANRKGMVYSGRLIVNQTEKEFYKDLKEFFYKEVGDSYSGVCKTMKVGDILIAIAWYKPDSQRGEVYRKFGFIEETV